MEDNIVLHNPTEVPVTNYPIQHPKNKEVLTWSIGPGQTLRFPRYVGEYLYETYGFLQKVMTQQELDQERLEAEKLNKGKHFDRVRIEAPKAPEVQTPPAQEINQTIPPVPPVA